MLSLLLLVLVSQSTLSASLATVQQRQVGQVGRAWDIWRSGYSYPVSRKSRSQLLARASVPSGWTQTGCFTDALNLRTLSGYSNSTSSNTVATCLNSCQSRGYALGGVEYGQECYCGNSMTVSSNPSTGQSAPLTDCSTSCAGDSTQTCGGGNRIMVYRYTGSSGTWSAKGCYTDSTTRALGSYSTTSSSNTPASCEATCLGQGYTLAGVEYGSECWCANSITVSSGGGSLVSSSDCNMQCSGDSSQTCGAGYRIFIYSFAAASSTTSSTSTTPTTTTTTTSSAPSSTWTSVGCYADSSNRVLAAYSTSSGSMTNDQCQNTCNSLGYSYAGTEYSSECYCANSIRSGASSSTSCTMTCAGNSGQTCGGPWAISVYRLVSGTSTTTPPPTTTTTTSSTSPTSTWSSLGCYQDSNSRILSSYSTTSSSNTPSFCQSLCLSKGYSFAGTEYGQECYCGSALNNGAVSISSSNCNSPCAGNSAQNCGGAWAINVYQFTGSTSTTATATTTTTTTASTTTTSTSTPAASKVVVAHYMVGNTYSYSQSTWSSNIQAAMAGGIDGFALNVGIDSWQPQRVSDAYAAASGTPFKLFLSFDMTSLPCGGAGDANLLRSYINNYASHPNQLFYQGKQVVSTFSGSDCTFSQGNLNAGWTYAIKTGVSNNMAFIPSFFSDISTFSSNYVQNGDFNWNGGWPMSSSDIDFSSDQAHINANSGRYYMAAVTPLFFTHYGPNTYNKNWIYRSDDHLYNTRWDMLIQHRSQIDIVQIISWNDYGESHYIGPIGQDQPNSQAWVNGFDHTAWIAMTKYYADAWRTGAYPTITQNKIYLSSRPHPKTATACCDSVSIPNNWQWTDDNIYAVVFSVGTYTLQLSIGSSSGSFPITQGVNKIKLAMSPGSPTARLVDSGGATVLAFSPSFSVVSNPQTYNFNYYMAASS